jgi:CheY-like chemotaxis protein
VRMKNKKNNGVLQTEESAGAQARCQATPSNRILVVDDDVDIRQANAEVLRRFANSYDLLITDNNMSKVSGVKLVKKVRSAHMTLPVILASGTLPTEELDRNPWLQPIATLVKAFSSGQLLETRYWRICVRSKWLVKPFSTGQLLETVNEVLSQPTVHAAARESTFPVMTGAVPSPQI